MKPISSLVLLISLFLFTNCSDEEAEIRERGQRSTIVSLFMAGFFKPNYCSAPEILLEEGKVYNITLEPGKRFWFTFVENQAFKQDYKKIRLTINRTTTQNIYLSRIGCEFTISNRDRGNPTSSTPTETIYEFDSYGSFDSTGFEVGHFLEIENESANVSITYTLI
ncbi:hypothetical protein JWG40_07795 [Leptospira sp. 201903074]|uniref:hypothetical protein n=1 Tax=Leptospira abararensis TaxID=2810036 RepID=UPI001965551C|nr:hypothetical protein [Leptospira abararensis]MBM9546915.1 hypothetical protein [Leptospira abararensis]